ncbi:MAG: shikimate dehydrogenase [Rickettsiales bacterium]|nr:shikimate dehydrogenase [Rickettsiales bacterium]
MKIKAGVIGYPVKHSLSPKIHGFLLDTYDIDGSYEKLEISPNDLKFAISQLLDEGYKGFNVTIPHKEEIFKICNYTSKSAFLTKAVNTIVITEDKKIFGHNSDVDGFIDNLKFNVSDFSFNHKTAFVVGAGGAARAIIYGLIKSGMTEINITNRNSDRANKIIKDFKGFCDENNAKIHLLSKDDFESALGNCDLLVNSTCLGMDGQDELKLNISKLHSHAVVYDIVYKPLMTHLLSTAHNRGNKVVTGIGMLVFQALIGFELWFKEKPEEKYVNELITLCLEH